MTPDLAIPRDVPTDAVTVTLHINGQALEENIQLLGLVVHKEANRIPYARIYLRDGSASTGDFPVSNGDSFIPGNEIEIYAGYRAQEELIFKGRITRHGLRATRDHPPTLEVECRDAAFRMTLGRKNKYFHEMKDSDVFEQLIQSYGLEAEVSDSGFTNSRLVQYNATDWDFMLVRAEITNMVVLANDGKVEIRTPDLSLEPVLSLTYGSDLFEFETEMDARDQYTGLTSAAWNPANQELTETEAADPGLEEPGNLSSDDLAAVNGGEGVIQRHGGELTTEELQSWSDSALLRSRLAKIKGRLSLQGYAAIKPGDVIDLNGLGDRFNGKVFVSSVKHDIAEGNWVTHVQTGLTREWFSAEPDIAAPKASGLLPALHGLQIGIVTQLDSDPDGEFRVRLRLPAVDAGDDGIWARVSTLDAGDNRGTFFLPEVGDEVVVGFLNDDPRNPIVLGMMNSSARPAAFQASSSNAEKGFTSREGLKMVFNDENKSITLETPAGNKCVLDDNASGITLQDQNGNKIVMGSSGISIESASEVTLKATTDIKLEGVNISVSPSASLKMSASGSLEMNASGTVKVQGAIVQIN